MLSMFYIINNIMRLFKDYFNENREIRRALDVDRRQKASELTELLASIDAAVEAAQDSDNDDEITQAEVDIIVSRVGKLQDYLTGADLQSPDGYALPDNLQGEVTPRLAALRGTLQNASYDPEGKLLEAIDTMQAVLEKRVKPKVKKVPPYAKPSKTSPRRDGEKLARRMK